MARFNHNLFAAGPNPGDAQVYRKTPVHTGATTTLGADATAQDSRFDAWAEVYTDNATSPTFVLIAAAGQTVDSTRHRVIDAT